MNTNPSIDTLLEGFQFALQEEISPFLANPKAQATAAMMQSLIQELRQLIPVYDRYIAEEHNAMIGVFRECAGHLDGVTGVEADRIRERAAKWGVLAEVSLPPEQEPIRQAHRAMTLALQETITDLDALQRVGDARADAALDAVRAHLVPRIVRDVATVSLEGGFVGRG
jgi:hypothetical protein